MTELLLWAAKFVLRFLYLFLRPLPVRNKIVFFSRQSSEIPLDFRLLAEELERVSPETELRFFCRKMRRKTNVVSYALFILRSLVHLSACAVARPCARCRWTRCRPARGLRCWGGAESSSR